MNKKGVILVGWGVLLHGLTFSMLPQAEKGETKMSLDNILIDDRLTTEQRNAMISMLEKAGEGFIDLMTMKVQRKQEGEAVQAKVEENEEVIDAYSILAAFLPREAGGTPEITSFVDKIMLGSESDGGNGKMKKCIRSFEEKDFDLCDEPLTFALEYAYLYFAIGYVLGQTFDISPGDPDREKALEAIEALKKELKQAGILPYWSRNLTSNNPSVA